MKNTWKIVPMFALALLAFGCGGGGGTSTPQDLAKSVVDQITSGDYDSVYDMQPLHLSDPEYDEVRRAYRIEEGFLKWEDFEDDLNGDKDEGIEALDPEELSGIEDEEDWKDASAGKLYALENGLYKINGVKKFDERIEAEFYLTGVDVYEEGGERRSIHQQARVSFANKYGDRIRVYCIEDQGLWYLAGVNVSFPEELPEPPKDED